MSILFRQRAQILVGVNGCYVTEFFSHFGCYMGIARINIQCVICACKNGGTILVRVSFYYVYASPLVRCWRALVTC